MRFLKFKNAIAAKSDEKFQAYIHNNYYGSDGFILFVLGLGAPRGSPP